jgi:hypothetical protein
MVLISISGSSNLFFRMFANINLTSPHDIKGKFSAFSTCVSRMKCKARNRQGKADDATPATL